jgi:hypothetical protein
MTATRRKSFACLAGYQNVGEAMCVATAAVAGGQNVDSLNVQKQNDATLEEEEQKRKKK